MTILGKNRRKGILLMNIIGLGLFAFIAVETFCSCETSGNRARQQIGSVLGDKITYDEFQKLVDEFSDVIKLSAGRDSFTEDELNQVRDQVWNTFVSNKLLEAEAEKLLHDAQLLDKAGCFGITLEKVPAALAAEVTKLVKCPTIGIGAGNGCDGQVLVVADMLGMTQGFSPRFLRRYADLNTVITDAVGHYVEDVKSGDFPNANESY